MAKKRILVVDDEPEILETLKEFLAARGYGVTTASSGAEALGAVKEQRPHLVLLDIVMPGMDGVETLRRIREIDRAARVIIITGLGDAEIAKRALPKLAFDCIAKPLDLDYLETSIMTCLAHTRPSPRRRAVGSARGKVAWE